MNRFRNLCRCIEDASELAVAISCYRSQHEARKEGVGWQDYVQRGAAPSGPSLAHIAESYEKPLVDGGAEG